MSSLFFSVHDTLSYLLKDHFDVVYMFFSDCLVIAIIHIHVVAQTLYCIVEHVFLLQVIDLSVNQYRLVGCYLIACTVIILHLYWLKCSLIACTVIILHLCWLKCYLGSCTVIILHLCWLKCFSCSGKLLWHVQFVS